MIWHRVFKWFVFSLLLLSPIIAAENDDKVIVEDFDEIYYMEDTGNVEISTEITFVGDNYNDGHVPMEVKFYTMEWEVLSEEDVDSNKVRTKVGMGGTYGRTPIYEYHNYTATFGFETNLTGDLEFRLMVYLGDNYYGCNEVYTIHINPGLNPSDNSVKEEVFFTSTVVIIFIIIIVVTTIMSIAARKVVRERKELSSKTSTGLEINSGDAEMDNIVRGIIGDDRLSINDDTFDPASGRDTRVLETHSEMNEVR